MSALLSTGCASRFARPPVPPVIAVPAPKDGIGNYTLNNYKTDLAAYAAASGPEAIRLRNKMAYSVMAEIDYVFFNYETQLYLNQGAMQVGSDALQLGLAAAGTITNGARSKTVLSAILSGVTGVSLSVDKNFFRQQTVQAISSSMEANRDRIKTVILQQLKQDTSTYPYEATRADLIKYFFAGTLPAGLQELHQTAAANAKDQQTNLNQVQVGNISAADVECVTKANAALADAAKKDDLSKVIQFLNAMGVTIDQSLAKEKVKDKVEESFRQLGAKITTDETLRKKYCDEVKKAFP